MVALFSSITLENDGYLGMFNLILIYEVCSTIYFFQWESIQNISESHNQPLLKFYDGMFVGNSLVRNTKLVLHSTHHSHLSNRRLAGMTTEIHTDYLSAENAIDIYGRRGDEWERLRKYAEVLLHEMCHAFLKTHAKISEQDSYEFELLGRTGHGCAFMYAGTALEECMND
jgi:hypothetical protein